MGTCLQTTTIQSTPRDLYLGQAPCSCIDFSAVSRSALNGTSFAISSLDQAYYVWFNVDGTGTDPVGTGVGIEITIDTTKSLSADLRDAVAEIDAVVDANNCFVFVSNTNGSKLEICVNELGESSASADVDSGLVIEFTQGYSEKLGCTSGDLSYSSEISEFEALCHQTGTIPLDVLITGANASLTVTLLDTGKERLRLLLEKGVGGSFTPSNSTEEAFGLGTSIVGQSLQSRGSYLVLHPVSKPLSDKSEDIVFFNATPLISSYTFSSTEQDAIELDFKILPNFQIRDDINIYGCVDYRKDVRKLVA